MSTHEERMRRIEEHFKNITIEELEAGLERSGMERIKPLSSDGLRLTELNEIYSTSIEWETDGLQNYQYFDSSVKDLVGFAA
jgi:hypothetical protein